MSKAIDRGKRHDLGNIDQGLVYLAMNYGKTRKASRKMAEDGLTPIPPATLDYWKKVSHPERYEQLRAETEKRRDLNAAERMDALVRRALDIEADILDKTAESSTKSTLETSPTLSRTSRSAQASCKTSPTASREGRPSWSSIATTSPS
jgi:hypothetical protein